MVVFNVSNRIYSSSNLILIDVLNNELYMAKFEEIFDDDDIGISYEKLYIMKRPLYDPNPHPVVVFKASGIFSPLYHYELFPERCACVMSDDRSSLNLLFYIKKDIVGFEGYAEKIRYHVKAKDDKEYGCFLLHVDLESNETEIFELDIDILKFYKDASPMMKIKSDGNIVIFHRYHQRGSDIFKISTISKDEDSMYSLITVEADFNLTYEKGTFQFKKALIRTVKFENGYTWFLLDDNGKLAVCDTSGILKHLTPRENSDQSFLKAAKYDKQIARCLYYEHGRLYFARSFGLYNNKFKNIDLYNHVLYELEIFYNDSTFCATQIGRIEKMHCSSNVIMGNGMIVSTYKDVCMYGLFRMPTLAELAFMQIQKMTSKKLKIEDKVYFSTRAVYEGGISEQELKKTLGMNGEVRLIPLID